MVKLGVAFCLLLEHRGFASMQTSCSAHSQCAGLEGDCCPTAEGLMLDCCSEAPASLHLPPASPPDVFPPVVVPPVAPPVAPHVTGHSSRDSVLTKALSKQSNAAQLMRQHLMQQQALQQQAQQQQQALQRSAMIQQETQLKMVRAVEEAPQQQVHQHQVLQQQQAFDAMGATGQQGALLDALLEDRVQAVESQAEEPRPEIQQGHTLAFPQAPQALQDQLQQQQALQQAAMRRQEALLNLVQAVESQAEESPPEIQQQHKPAPPQSPPVLEEEAVQEQVVQERLLELEMSRGEPTDKQPEHQQQEPPAEHRQEELETDQVAGLRDMVAELKARLDIAEQQTQKAVPEEPLLAEVLHEDEAPPAQVEEEMPPTPVEAQTAQVEEFEEEMPPAQIGAQSAQVEEETPPAQDDIVVEAAIAAAIAVRESNDDLREGMLRSVLVQDADEEALLAAQKQAEFDAQDEDNLMVSEAAPAQDNVFEVEESVQGLVVSVKELWSCVTELKKQTEESAKEEQDAESGCSGVTAEYVHKYARTYAQEYTRQYVQTYHQLLQEKSKQAEFVSAAEIASVDACDIANETVDELGDGCDAEGVVLELPAFVTAKGDLIPDVYIASLSSAKRPA